jgi:serine protease inhibitor
MSIRLFLIPALAAMLQAAESPGVPGMNHFATDCYRQLARGRGNLVFSPFSITSALSMALDGARGQTAANMAAVLHTDPAAGNDAALSQLAAQLAQAANGGGNQLLNANRLWIQKGLPLEAHFQQRLNTYYNAPPVSLDFANPDAARAAINSWTSQHTNGKIQDLFAPGALNARTRLVLTSAIYFYGRWESTFRARDTRPAPFKLAAGNTAEVPFMNQTASFGYAETPSLQVLEMRYAGTGLAFDVLLPKAVEGLPELETSLTPENLGKWLGALQGRRVEVVMPKFRLEASFSLRDNLSLMGMGEAFSGAADFSGIDGRRDLALSAVVHKAFVDVAEEGTEAAAATGAAVALVSMVHTPAKTVFRADHPFIFLIRDTHSGVLLFAGRLVNPKS